jgi:hypothetical protein
VSNYPALEDWLDTMDAVCMYQEVFGKNMIEMWMIKGRPFIVLVHPNGLGWNIFTDGSTGDVKATLDDAEKRITATYK